MSNSSKIYLLPSIFTLLVLGLIIFKVPQGDIKNYKHLEPQTKLHVFEGYSITGNFYQTKVSYSISSTPSPQVQKIENTIAACYGYCLKDKNCLAVSSSANTEDGQCQIYTAIERIVQDPRSKMMLRFSERKEHLGYNVLSNINLASHNLADFEIDQNDEPTETCFELCHNNKSCASFVIQRTKKTYHCWLKDTFANQDLTISKKKNNPNTFLGIIINRVSS